MGRDCTLDPNVGPTGQAMVGKKATREFRGPACVGAIGFDRICQRYTETDCYLRRGRSDTPKSSSTCATGIEQTKVESSRGLDRDDFASHLTIV